MDSRITIFWMWIYRNDHWTWIYRNLYRYELLIFWYSETLFDHTDWGVTLLATCWLVHVLLQCRASSVVFSRALLSPLFKPSTVIFITLYQLWSLKSQHLGGAWRSHVSIFQETPPSHLHDDNITVTSCWSQTELGDLCHHYLGKWLYAVRRHASTRWQSNSISSSDLNSIVLYQ